jgi:hypothetical protein
MTGAPRRRALATEVRLMSAPPSPTPVEFFYVTALRGRGFFGPVVVPVPRGDEALTLFEALRLAADVPSFSELKTKRNQFGRRPVAQGAPTSRCA